MRVDIRVPATSANIGAGFDSLGLAVQMHNRVVLEPWEGVEVLSLDGTAVPAGENNLVYKTVKYLFDICGKPLPGLRIQQENPIPMARGLGSSSACIVAGLMGGNTLSQEDIIHMAATMEGHPDNSTPAILGGQVSAAIENGRVFYCRQELRDDLRFAAIIPDFELKTSAARAALPKEISRADGVFNLSRAALMAMSLAAGQYENLRVAAQDRLHQPYRLELIPGARAVMDCALEFGAYCTYISGAGSTLMAVVGTENSSFLQRLRCWMDGQGYGGWRLLLLPPDNGGARLTTEEPHCTKIRRQLGAGRPAGAERGPPGHRDLRQGEQRGGGGLRPGGHHRRPHRKGQGDKPQGQQAGDGRAPFQRGADFNRPLSHGD